jgi:hypothetical protein
MKNSSSTGNLCSCQTILTVSKQHREQTTPRANNTKSKQHQEQTTPRANNTNSKQASHEPTNNT